MRTPHRRTPLIGLTAVIMALTVAGATPATATEPMTEPTTTEAASAVISGRITDEATGKPLAACVTATTQDEGEWGYESACAGDDGRYEIPVSAGRTYQVFFSYPDYVDEYYDGVSDPNEATPVAAGGTANASLQAARPVTGIVTYTDGTPIEGAQVRFYPAGSLNYWGTADTGADGTWSANLLWGTYNIQYVLPDGDQLWSNGKTSRPNRPTLTVKQGKTPTSQKTKFAPAASVLARVIDQSGSPVEDVCVETEAASACTDEDGLARLSPLPSGRVTLIASTAKGSLGAVQRDVTLKRGATTKVTIKMALSAVIKGTVVGENGKPRPKVCVQAVAAEGPYLALLDKQRVTCTNSEGQWFIRGIPSGRYAVQIFGDETHPNVYSPGVALPKDARAVTTRAGQTIDAGITLAGVGGSVKGVVTAPDGTPVPDAWVVLGGDNPARIGDGGAGLYTAQTAADGSYEITNVPQWSVPAMAYLRGSPYAFTYTGGATDSASAQKVQVTWGATTTADVRFVPEAPLQITMTGVPRGFSVEFDVVTSAGDAAGFGGYLDADKPTTVIHGLGAGKVRIMATMTSQNATTSTMRTWWYPYSILPSAATPVTLTEGTVTELTWAAFAG